MSTARSRERIEEAFRDTRIIDEALKLAFKNAVIEHYIAGVPMVFSENGKIVKVPAEQVAAENGIELPSFPRPPRENRKHTVAPEERRWA